MTTKEDHELHYVQIRTKTSYYVMPRVDLEKYRALLKPEHGNPCLQIINEDLNVLSIVWSQVTEINIAHFMVTEGVAGYKLETLWQSVA